MDLLILQHRKEEKWPLEIVYLLLISSKLSARETLHIVEVVLPSPSKDAHMMHLGNLNHLLEIIFDKNWKKDKKPNQVHTNQIHHIGGLNINTAERVLNYYRTDLND